MLIYADDDARICRTPKPCPSPVASTARRKSGRFFSELITAMQSTRFVIKDVVAENDKVVVLAEAMWTVRSTGRSYDNQWVHVFTLRDHKFIGVESLYYGVGRARVRPDRPNLMAAATALRH